jgi:aryl-alcohol dehydrogenase-like predicted oxidoreductase
MESGLLTNKTTAEWIDALPETDWRRHKPDHPVAANIHLPRREPFLKFLGTLDSIAKEAGHTIGQLAVAWTLRRPEVTSAIVGARRPGQITETAQAGDWALSDEELTAIETAHADFLGAIQ